MEKFWRMEKAKALQSRIRGCAEDLFSYARQLEEIDMKEDGEGLRKLANKIEDWTYGGKLD